MLFKVDNSNTNSSALLPRGKAKVITKLYGRMKRVIAGKWCGAHTLHNCVQSGYDMPETEADHIYTVNVTETQCLCDVADIEYKTLLRHGNTRFRSLFPGTAKRTEMYELWKPVSSVGQRSRNIFLISFRMRTAGSGCYFYTSSWIILPC
jgi:hypothetical protein